jgi:hypothetical protein
MRKKNSTKKTVGIPHREESRRTGGVLKDEVDRITAAVVTIMNSSETPNDLYEKVETWITNSVNIQDSQGESLVDRWNSSPECIAACLEWAREAEGKRESAEALPGKAVSE